MWRWLKHFTGWLMRDWLPQTFSSLPLTAAPQVRGLKIGWKKNGLEVEALPVLATADEVWVRAELRYPIHKSHKLKRSDVTLRTSRLALPADSLIREGMDVHQSIHRVEFRLPPLEATDTVELRWQGQLLCQVAVPVLSLQQFVEQLQLLHPTVFVNLHVRGDAGPLEYMVPCTRYVRSQGRGLQASALFVSTAPHVPLAALLDCQPTVVFCEESTNQVWEVPISLTAEQLLDQRAVVTVCCPVRPRQKGHWTIEWRVLRNKTLRRCSLEVRAMRSLHHLIDFLGGEFVWWDDKTNQLKRIGKQPPKQLTHGRIGPCFLLRSRETGLAFVASVEVYATCEDGLGPRLLKKDEVVITDAPTTYIPGTIAASDFHKVVSFELRVGDRTIGHLPLHPIPSAKINSEGAFQGAPDDIPWSPALDEELRERLRRLSDQP